MKQEEKGKGSGKLHKYLKCAVIGVTTGMANGLFGSGGGTIAVPAMVHLLGADEHKAHATAISVILPLTVVSSVFYISRGYTDWGLTLKVTLGGFRGIPGSKAAQYLPRKLLEKYSAYLWQP